jgi:hypothetical protein
MRLGFDFLCDYFKVMDMISSSITKVDLHNANKYLDILANTKWKYDAIDHLYFDNQINQLHFEVDFLKILINQGVRLQRVDEPIKHIYSL